MKRSLMMGLAAIVAIAAPVTASAAPIYASFATVEKNGPRGSADGRDDITNAYGAPDGDFYELGFGTVHDFQFGTPTGQPFRSPGSLVEITFNNNPDWVEAVKIEVGLAGDPDSFVSVSPDPFLNTATASDPSFTFAGLFDTVRLTDITKNYDSQASRGSSGGFDVDAIGVTPVPLPGAGMLLAGALCAAGAAGARRRRG